MNHGAATVLRGTSSRVFVIGGQRADGSVVDGVDEYIASGISALVSPHTPLPGGGRTRFGISSSTSTNQVFVFGGLDSDGVAQTSILELSVATNGTIPGILGTPSGTWTQRGNLSAARCGLGVSTPPGVTNFLPSRNAGRSDDQDAIATWVRRAVRSARAPSNLDTAQVTMGRSLFGTEGLVIAGSSCATCHGGPLWTRSSVDYPSPPSPETGIGLGNERVIGAELRQTSSQSSNVLVNVGTFTTSGRFNEIRVNAADAGQTILPLGANGFNVPSLLSCAEGAPYFYSGLAQTLEDVLNGSADGNGGTRHHFVQDPAQRAALVAFLRSIDETTSVFP
jgi:hypothetical protein